MALTGLSTGTAADIALTRDVSVETGRSTAPKRERYSAFTLLKHALNGNRRWQPAWTSKDPKPSYDVVVIGGGGHELATAYYLAKRHGITDVTGHRARLDRRRQYRS